jgi:hypothetical protein
MMQRHVDTLFLYGVSSELDFCEKRPRYDNSRNGIERDTFSQVYWNLVFCSGSLAIGLPILNIKRAGEDESA